MDCQLDFCSAQGAGGDLPPHPPRAYQPLWAACECTVSFRPLAHLHASLERMGAGREGSAAPPFWTLPQRTLLAQRWEWMSCIVT